MADLARANERLRVSLEKSQKRVSELHDALDAQRKSHQELLTKMKDLERRLGPEADEEIPSTWFADLLRWGRPKSGKGKTVEISGCQSISCCMSLISGWALETGRFLLTGVWEFFWDPVAWWKEAKGSLQAVLEAQVQMVSRAIGFLLMGLYINGVSWVCLRIRSIGGAVHRGWEWVMGLSTISLARLVILWGARKVTSGIPEVRRDNTAKLLERMEELTRLVKKQQSSLPPDPQRASPAIPAAGRSRKICPNCGKGGHSLIECRKPKRCLKCQSTKHLARDCPQAQVTGNRKEGGRARFAPPPVGEVEDFRSEGDVASLVEDLCREVETEVRAAEGSRAPVLHVKAGIGSSRELVLVDTGSSVNVLPLSFAEAHGLELSTDSEEAGMRLRAFNGTSSKVAGTTLVSVTVGRWKATIPFLVTDACSSIIIGMPGLRDLDVKVDPAQRRLEDREGHLVCCQRADISAPAYSLEAALQKN